MSTQATVQYTNTAYTPKKQENKDDKQPRSFRYLCPKCKGPVKEHHTDDVQTWYVCTKNPGHLTAAPLKQEFDDIEQYQEWFCANIGKALAEKKAKEAAFQEELKQLALNPAIEQFILDEVHRTVSSHDDHVIKAVFHAGISAYASPLNLALKCESGSGKTYSTTQTIKFLPPENVLLIGKATKTAHAKPQTEETLTTYPSRRNHAENTNQTPKSTANY